MKRGTASLIAVLTAGFMLCFALPVWARDIIELVPGKSAPPFHRMIQVMFDETRKMGLEEARAHPEWFRRNETEQINAGITGDVIWLRLDAVNAGVEPGGWLLHTLMRSAEILDFYLIRDGRAQLLFSARDSGAALQNHDALAAEFQLAPGEQVTIYIRYLNQNISRIPLQILSFADAAAIRQANTVIFTIVAASVAAFAVYSTAIFMLIGGRAILYYAIAEIGMLLLLANFDGLLSIDAGAYTPIVRRVAPAIYSAMVLIFAALFARNFFPLKMRAPRADLFLQVFLGAGCAYLLATLLSAGAPQLFDMVQIVPYLLLAVLWLFLQLLAVYATFRWRAGYWPLIPGFFSVLFAHGYWILVVQNLVPEPPFPPRLLGFNFVIQGFFMAIAVVLQVRQLRENQLRAQLDLNAALQKQLTETSRNAEMLHEMAEVGRLVQAASHDTRSILHGLRSIAGGLKADVDTARAAQAAEQINYLTDDLEAVFGATMAGAVSGGNDDILALETVPLGGVMSALQMIHGRAFSATGLRFQTYGGGHELVSDRALLMRILGNLIDNARQYTSRGGVILAARRHGGDLRIQVWDSGPGIGAELLSRLLDPAAGRMRGDDTIPGQGSGLQTAKSLAVRLGGRLDACSRPGQGSRFELVLPRAPAAGIRAMRLWIGDDDPRRAAGIRAMAQGMGMEAAVLSGQTFDPEAIGKEDLALLDMSFGGDGVQAAIGLGALLPRNQILIATYDRGVDVRARLAPAAGTILYHPVSLKALDFAMRRGM